MGISIHSSHTGRDAEVSIRIEDESDFNPLFPYGKRQGTGCAQLTVKGPFQSTLPIREETGMDDVTIFGPRIFQSTLPIREETAQPIARRPSGGISIHSSHTGRDASTSSGFSASSDFNPLFPYGKRHVDLSAVQNQINISIHSSHTGRDFAGSRSGSRSGYFNPLFPYGKRPSPAPIRQTRC